MTGAMSASQVGSGAVRRQPASASFESAWRSAAPSLLQAILVFCVLAGLYVALPWLRVAFDKPINRVLIKGELHALSEQAIRNAVVIYETDTFLAIDLDALVHRLEQQPWIDHARVRRVWPDALEITLVEQNPIAYWGDKAMLNAKGRIFEHMGLYQGRPLPRLWSELGSPAETMNYYEVFRQSLEPAQLHLQSISQSIQGDWWLQLENGLVVILDRADPVGNARHFLMVHERLLAKSERKPEVVDLRYRNGAAIRWQPMPIPVPAGDGSSPPVEIQNTVVPDKAVQHTTSGGAAAMHRGVVTFLVEEQQA